MSDADATTLDLLDHAPCGLIATTPRGLIVAANETLLGWLGHSRDELVGRRHLTDLMTIPGRIHHETHFAPLLRMQGFVHEIAVDLLHREGRQLPAFLSANERRGPSGDVQSVRIGVFLAADRRKYERELLLARQLAEQSLKAKSDFLAVFAHEVRNPLSAVSFAVERLARTVRAPEDERPVAILRRSLDRVIALLDNMLDFSKIEAGKVRLDERRFDLRELLRGVAQTLEAISEAKRVPIEVRVDERVPDHLVGDGVKIGQVVANLAGNALKFTAEGSVEIAVDLVGASPRACDLRFRVSDTGIGIPPERLARIFDEYAQGGPEISADYGGTGLGLAISRRIVALHGSKILVVSEPGAGTTFTFDLSLKPAVESAAS